MGRLHQIQIAYDPHEDRALLRVGTVDSAEFRFWMTRRFVKLLWPVLLKMLEASPQVSVQAHSQARSAVLAFEHDKAISESDFETRFADGPKELPLGEDPVLLARIGQKRNAEGRPVLALHPREGQGVDLVMHESLLHSFCKLLADAVNGAGWDIRLTMGTGAGAETPPERVN